MFARQVGIAMCLMQYINPKCIDCFPAFTCLVSLVYFAWNFFGRFVVVSGQIKTSAEVSNY